MEGRRIGTPIVPTLKEWCAWIKTGQLLTPFSGSAPSVKREIGPDGPEVERIWPKGSLQIEFGVYESLLAIYRLSGISILASMARRILGIMQPGVSKSSTRFGPAVIDQSSFKPEIS